MAGKVYSKSKALNLQEEDDISHQVLQEMLEKCFDSWFDRHASNAAMKEGTANEVPTIAKLTKYGFILHIFEVGLLQSSEHTYIGVSTY